MIFKALPALFATALVGTAAAQSSVNIIWNRNPERNVNKYNVLFGSSRENLSVIQTVANPAATLSGLSPATTYYCAVQAVNTENLASPLSSVMSFATQALSTAPEIAVERSGVNLTDGSSSVNFGRIPTGNSSASQTFTIRNLGNANLTGISISRSGGQASNFPATSPSTSTLAPGASTTFTVRFSPIAAGARSTTLRIASNDSNENPFDITLRGTGTATATLKPEIDVIMAAPEPVRLVSGQSTGNLRKAPVGGSGAPRYFTIRNTGNNTLSGLKIGLGGKNASNFMSARLAKTSLAPNESTQFWVTFKPKGKGKKGAVLNIRSNDADESNFQIRLIGIGVPAPRIEAITLKGKELVDGKSVINRGIRPIRKSGSPFNIIVKNTGDAPLKSLTFNMTGRNPSDFIVISPKIKTLKPGRSIKVKIAFKPRAKGPRRAWLNIRSNDRATPSFDIALIGKGKALTSAGSSASGSAASAPVQSYAWADGGKFRAITVVKSSGETIAPRDIQVSSNLVDWFSGDRHTTVIKNNAAVLKIRDKTPLNSGTQRYIRLRPGH